MLGPSPAPDRGPGPDPDPTPDLSPEAALAQDPENVATGKSSFYTSLLQIDATMKLFFPTVVPQERLSDI